MLEGLSPQEEEIALHLMEALIRSREPSPRSMGLVGELTGARVIEEELGRVVFRFDVQPWLYNPYGVLAGPVLYTVIDYSMGRALRTLAQEGELAATIELKTNYLKAVREGSLTIRTSVLHKGSAIAVLESLVTDDDGLLVAIAIGTFRVLPPARGQLYAS